MGTFANYVTRILAFLTLPFCNAKSYKSLVECTVPLQILDCLPPKVLLNLRTFPFKENPETVYRRLATNKTVLLKVEEVKEEIAGKELIFSCGLQIHLKLKFDCMRNFSSTRIQKIGMKFPMVFSVIAIWILSKFLTSFVDQSMTLTNVENLLSIARSEGRRNIYQVKQIYLLALKPVFIVFFIVL